MALEDQMKVTGYVVAQLRAEDGTLKQELEFPNIVTSQGRQNYAAAYASMSVGTGVSVPNAVYGMQLGTSNNPVNSGDAIQAYISGSTRPITTGWPQLVVISSTITHLRWKCVFGAGVATNTSIKEVTMVTSSADAAASAANTVSRALFPTTLDKWATDTLTVLWIHIFS